MRGKPMRASISPSGVANARTTFRRLDVAAGQMDLQYRQWASGDTMGDAVSAFEASVDKQQLNF